MGERESSVDTNGTESSAQQSVSKKRHLATKSNVQPFSRPLRLTYKWWQKGNMPPRRVRRHYLMCLIRPRRIPVAVGVRPMPRWLRRKPAWRSAGTVVA